MRLTVYFGRFIMNMIDIGWMYDLDLRRFIQRPGFYNNSKLILIIMETTQLGVNLTNKIFQKNIYILCIDF